MTTWKQAERKIAELLGGVRVPITGRQRGDVPDIDHPWLSIEVKHRRNFPPKWIDDALNQAWAAMEKNNRFDKIPIAVFHGKGEQYLDSIVMMKVEDLLWLIESRTDRNL